MTIMISDRTRPRCRATRRFLTLGGDRGVPTCLDIQTVQSRQLRWAVLSGPGSLVLIVG